MVDGAGTVRIEAPAEQRERVRAHRSYLPLRLKLGFIVMLSGALIYLAFRTAPSLLPPYGTYAIVGAFAVSLVMLVLLMEVAFVQPLRRLIRWFEAARASGFAQVGPMPVSSHDELGQLGHHLAATVSSFWSAEERVRVLLAHKAETISMIEHQLRTPLTGLRWSLERYALPANVQTALIRIETTVRAIIEAARIEDGRFGYTFAQVDIVPIIDQTIASFRPLAESRNVALEFNHPGSVGPVKADADRIGIVMANLISNAVDYTVPGGRVQVSATAVAGGVEVVITDTGIGIPQSEMPLIFNKMHRGENAKHMRPDGSGLGLFTAKNILHAHGAEIALQSEEGKGTIVRFRLPAMQ